jgi:uncharacterized protein YciI
MSTANIPGAPLEDWSPAVPFGNERMADGQERTLTRPGGTADHANKCFLREDRHVMSVDARVAELTQKMWKRKFYALLSQPSPTPEKLKPLLPAHLEYMISLEKSGVLFASGPLSDGKGPPTGAGLTILRVTGIDEARALAEADPFVLNGLRTFELKEWTIMEGTLGLRVNLSDQSVEVA